jgi:ubiquinone/menaquinone biosynthesis C-methylase UbiE
MKVDYSNSLNCKQAVASIADVREFWGVEPCGSHFVKAQKGTPKFYEEFRRFRYSTEWHIPLLVPFAETRGRSVLEIGCGNGADGVMFALAGANYTGVDLTEAAVVSTQAHFESLGLEGKFQTDNAECLTFNDESFDFVYSHGALHHTPNPEIAFAEVFRVLKIGGKAVLMLYHKHSFNYYVRILGYIRAQAMIYCMLRFWRHSSDRRHLQTRMLELRGNEHRLVWQAHYENFLRSGWSYFRSRNFVPHATDGPECPYAYVYTRKTVQNIFSRFRKVETKVAHFPLRKYSRLKWTPLFVERSLGSLMGWYLFVYLTK